MKTMTFFPSRVLAWYVARLFLVRSFAVLALLVVVLQSLDLLGQSGKVLAVPGNGQAEVLRYIGLRLPQIIAQFLPFAVLLGTIGTLLGLNQNSEIISMKAGGMSAHQILAPLIVASLFVAAISFIFNDRIVARATGALAAWQKVDYAKVPPNSGARTNIWVRDGDNLFHVGAVRVDGASVALDHVELFERRADAMTGIVSASHARYAGGQWVLDGARRFDVATGLARPIGTVAVARGVTPDRFTLANVKGDELAFAPLRQAIADLATAGRPTQALEAVLWHKVSGPLSAVLMPLLGAVAGFGLARSGTLFIRVVSGMMLGFTYFVADNFGLAMGNLGVYPPWLAAWGPFLLFLLIGELVLIRSEE